MTQFYFPDEIVSDEVQIFGEEYFHLVKSYRIKLKEKVRLFDGKGNVYLSEVINIKNDRITLKILTKAKYEKKKNIITIFQSIIKQDKFELILEKVTELGVDKIVPMITERTEVDIKKFVSKYDRFKKIILETSKQSNRIFLTELELPRKLIDIVKDKKLTNDKTENVVAYKGKVSKPVLEIASKIENNFSKNLFIGPTGDFTEEEINVFNSLSNIYFVDLGKNILKSETAAILTAGIFVQI
ncbi:MAG: RsmE family RNA methyltransferase [Endomicrobiia bacterium]